MLECQITYTFKYWKHNREASLEAYKPQVYTGRKWHPDGKKLRGWHMDTLGYCVKRIDGRREVWQYLAKYVQLPGVERAAGAHSGCLDVWPAGNGGKVDVTCNCRTKAFIFSLLCTFIIISFYNFIISNCVTIRKVIGSIPEEVIGIFYCLNPSDCIMSLDPNQPLR